MPDLSYTDSRRGRHGAEGNERTRAERWRRCRAMASTVVATGEGAGSRRWEVDRVEADGFGASRLAEVDRRRAVLRRGRAHVVGARVRPTALTTTSTPSTTTSPGIVPYVILVAIAILTIIVKTESLALPQLLVDPVLHARRRRRRHRCSSAYRVLRRRLRHRRAWTNEAHG